MDCMFLLAIFFNIDRIKKDFTDTLSTSPASLLHPLLSAFITNWFGKCASVQVACKSLHAQIGFLKTLAVAVLANKSKSVIL